MKNVILFGIETLDSMLVPLPQPSSSSSAASSSSTRGGGGRPGSQRGTRGRGGAGATGSASRGRSSGGAAVSGSGGGAGKKRKGPGLDMKCVNARTSIICLLLECGHVETQLLNTCVHDCSIFQDFISRLKNH